MLEHLKLTSFESHLNGIYRVALGQGQVVELVLESVRSNKTYSEKYECFSILFRGSRHIILQQGTYEMTHEQLGTFPLFIVPVDADEQGYYYEAVFNRKKSNCHSTNHAQDHSNHA